MEHSVKHLRAVLSVARTILMNLADAEEVRSPLPGTSLREAERRHIESALAATNWVIEGERRREDFGRSSEYVTQPHEKTKHPAAGRSAYERRAGLRGQKPFPARGNRQSGFERTFLDTPFQRKLAHVAVDEDHCG